MYMCEWDVFVRVWVGFECKKCDQFAGFHTKCNPFKLAGKMVLICKQSIGFYNMHERAQCVCV